MPEIGEVARVVHYLKKHAVGRTIAAVKVQDDPIVYGKVGTSAAAFQKAMAGKKVVDARQQGKYFWLEMDSPPHPLMHLGMTGWIRFSNDDTAHYRPQKEEEQVWPPKFWKFMLEMEEKSGGEIAFVDARRLARIRLVDVKAEDMRKTSPLKENGPDPVIDKDILTVDWLKAKMQSKKVPIKALLLDQGNISGVGNWVADEVLYQAKIHPEQYCNTFNEVQVKQLHDSLIEITTTAVETLAESDKFPEKWMMRHRWDKGKKNGGVLPNGMKMKFLTVGGRTSAIVPEVQKKTGAVLGDVDSGDSGEEEDGGKPAKGKNGKSGKSNGAAKKGKKSEPKPKVAKRGRKAKKEEDAEEEEEEDNEEQSEEPEEEQPPKKQRKTAKGMSNGGASKKKADANGTVSCHQSSCDPGIKTADQILRKCPNHADTQAMKALTLNQVGHYDQAMALAKEALKNDMKSHICWHVLGLLHRSQDNVEEAVKAYRFALKIEPESVQIARDLAFLQIQVRDYPGYIQSRRAMLNSKPMIRQNWTAMAVAHHMAGELATAENILKTYEGTLKVQPRFDTEHSEAQLYRNMIIAEMGEYKQALEHLETIAKSNLDVTSVMELRAEYLLKLDDKEGAKEAYKALIERNNEYRKYYEGLEKAAGLDRTNSEDLKQLAELYQTFAEQSERLDAARRIPLDFLQGDGFRSAAGPYLRRMLSKGIPSTFANIKALYQDTTKRAVFQDLALELLQESSANGSAKEETNGDGDRFKNSLLFFLAQHYNYHLTRDLSKATEYIDQALELDPKSVDFNMTKARILKHYGDLEGASKLMNHARELDEKDRYINTKCAKYQLRNNQTDDAIRTMSKFTRNETVGGPLGDLHDMQCMWFITEDGEANLRMEKYGVALKRFTAIRSIFHTWTNDQFDFHSFSLRKGQVRAYVEMLRWEDRLLEHPFFARAAVQAIKIYVLLAERPYLGQGLTNGAGAEYEAMDEAEKKKALKKARKEQDKADKVEQERLAALQKDKAKKSSGADGEPKKEDADPLGNGLLQSATPLEDAMKFVKPLLEYRAGNVEVQTAAFEVFIRRKKFLAALKCLIAARNFDPSDPNLHTQRIRFRRDLDAETELPTAAKEVIDEVLAGEGKGLVPSKDDLVSTNEGFLKEHANSARHVLAGLKVKTLLDPSKKKACEGEVVKVLDLQDVGIEEALEGLEVLREWRSESGVRGEYLSKAKGRWEKASVFTE
ncbi:TPR-like protein [Aulographum hederae CBS 113979]|uniref:DNA-(apurinic or apyrimidinic site) lyase n=1 Tax=Aulographum hederae CBS 113979 TaxID=1176131 RepID=A0A6G1GJU1_9PEZI|nr:TPR-like protein [Aulographum hederae CBS 113979]